MLPIQKIINSTLERKERTREIKKWHASKLGACLTGVYLERLGAKPDKPFDDRTLRLFNMGKDLEAWLVSKIIEGTDEKIETQVYCSDDKLNVHGYADFIVPKKEVVEIKTTHSRSFWYMVKKGQGPNISHKYQLWIYMYMMKIPRGQLLYYSRDDGAIETYTIFLRNEKLKKEVVGILKTLNSAWEKKLPPEPIRDSKDWRYRYCRWHSQCLNQKKYL